MKRFIWSLLLTFVLLALFVTPAFAQEILPGDQADQAQWPQWLLTIFSWLEAVVGFLFLLAAAAAGDERATEIAKSLLRKLSQLPGAKLLASLGHGWWSAMIALIVAVVAVYNPEWDVQLLQRFDLFAKALPPQLLSFVNVLLIWGGSHYVSQTEMFKGLFEAPPMESLKFKDFPRPKLKSPKN